MASPTGLMYAAAVSQLLPPAAWLARRPSSAAIRWIVAGCLVSFVGDAVQYVLGTQGINNLWLSYLTTPLIGGAFLWALAWLLPGGVGRLAIRLTVPAYLVVGYGLTVLLEDVSSFSRWVYPLHALLILAAAVWVLVRRGMDPLESGFLRADWFWVAGGLALHAATTLLLEPVLVVFVRDRLDLVIAAYQVRSASYVTAFVAITWGILCRNRATRFGPSSLPARSG